MASTQTVETTDGVRIAYEVEGAGAPLVLVHGITEHRRTWDDLVSRLCNDYTVIRLDLRGHGESTNGEDYSPPSLAGDVAAVVEAVGAGAPHVVGHSLGGLVVTAYAAFFPALSAINIDQPFQFADFAAMVREMLPELRGPNFLDALNNEMDVLAGPALPDHLKARLRELRSGARQEVVLALWEPVINQSDAEVLATVEALLPNVKVPYLSLHGTDLGPEYTAWLTGLIPTATVETWDGQGHWLHDIEPDRFAQRVRDFTAAAPA